MKLIGEIGINANGDINIAKQMINMAKGCGCWAVKFQKRMVPKVYSKEFLESPRESPWGRTQGTQKLGLEFGREDYQKINYHCKIIGIPWFASAWDTESLEFLESFDPPFHKIASPMLTNLLFVRTVASLGRPTFISTGMSKMEDILAAYDIFSQQGCEFMIMHCISLYPCPDDVCNIEMVQRLAGTFPDIKVGYSGHEVGIMPSLVAVAFGAEYIERHITLDRAMYGSDQSASLEARGIIRLVEYARQIEQCIGNGKKVVLPQEAENAKKMRYWEDEKC